MSDQRGCGIGLKEGGRNREGGLAGSNDARPGLGIVRRDEGIVEH